MSQMLASYGGAPVRLNRMLRFTICTVMLVSATLTLVSCSGSESALTFERILSVIPDTPDTRSWVAINDYARMRQEFKITVPGRNSTGDLYDLRNLNSEPQHLQFATTPGFFHGDGYVSYSLAALNNLGIDFQSIDQDVEARHPPRMIDILRGRFDPENTKQTLTVSAKNSPPLIEKYSGNTVYSWGEDYEINLAKRLTPPVYDNLGRGGRFIIQRDYLFRTMDTPTIKLIVDTQAGKHSSLSDVNEYRLMAQELSSLGALSALLSSQTQSLDNMTRLLRASDNLSAQEVEKLLTQGPKLLRYQTIAIGIAKDENGFYALVILVHEDDKAAAKNVTLLRQRIQETTNLYGTPWTSMISSSSITNHGRVLIAKLYGDMARAWLQWYIMSDPLVLRE